jgi:hypothetical protein
MAGLGYKAFTAGAVLTAAQVQGYLQDQAVMTFASSAARSAAITSPSQGMTTYLTDSNTYWQWFDAYNSSTNPGGAASAGWYPLSGSVAFHGVRDNASLNIPNATFTNITFNTFSNMGMTLDSTTTPGAITVPTAGFYRVTAYADRTGWSITTGTTRLMYVTKNGTTTAAGAVSVSLTTAQGFNEVSKLSVVLKLAASDVIRLYLQQDSGSTATNNKTGLSVEFVRPASV